MPRLSILLLRPRSGALFHLARRAIGAVLVPAGVFIVVTAGAGRDPLFELHDLEAGPRCRYFPARLGCRLLFLRSSNHDEPPKGNGTGNERRTGCRKQPEPFPEGKYGNALAFAGVVARTRRITCCGRVNNAHRSLGRGLWARSAPPVCRSGSGSCALLCGAAA